MGTMTTTDFGAFCEKSYLEYSMYVVLDRALPHVSDGLKPVQRRIIYAMSELGLDNLAKYKKSARTVGDVLGKYHPHGDSACYEAMVLMSQDFSYRYPLVDGQGNWGSRDDPKSFAAMRYTEARLSPYTQYLLAELKYDTVDWKPNFDGTLEEPARLPAQVPNVLINGTSGIAVGMATDIPAHNLGEVVDATVALLNNPDATVTELLAHIAGPDLPTRAEIITPADQIAQLYETGNGTFKMRATYHSEGKQQIVLDALPHMVSGEKVLEAIGELIQKKLLPMIDNLRDESDQDNPTRIVIEVKRNGDLSHEEIMEHLFAQTDLEKNYRANLNIIGLDGKPGVMSLRDILTQWITFRKATVTRKLNYHLDRINQRLHLIEGLLVAYANLDRVIQIVRESDTPKRELMEAFGLSDVQATAILEMRLRQLAKLEEVKLETEKAALLKDKKKIESILSSPAKMNAFIAHDLERIKAEYGDERLSPLVERASARPLATETLISRDPVTVVLSEKGWIKMAKSHSIDVKSLTYKTGDRFHQALKTTQDRPTIAISEKGQSYMVATHTLPSARSHGDHVTKYVNLKEGDRIHQIHDIDEGLYIMASSLGYGFLVNGEDILARKKAGKHLINVGDGQALEVRKLQDRGHHILVVTRLGYANAFPAEDLPQLGKGKGNKMITLTAEDEVAYVDAFDIDQGATFTINGERMILNRDSLGRALGKRVRKGYRLFSAIKTFARADA